MKIKREWADEPELFEAVADALDESDMVEEVADGTSARDEMSPYGDNGSITITLKDGRTFSLELHEERS